MILWITDICLLLLVIYNYLLHRDPAYPGFIHSFIWFAVMTLFTVYQGRFIEIDNRLPIVVLSGAVLFAAGSFMATFGHKPHLERNYVQEEFLPPRLIMAVLLVLVCLGFSLFAFRGAWLSSLGSTDNPYVNLRYSVSATRDETGGFGLLAYFIPLANVLAALAVLSYYGRRQPAISRAFLVAAILLASAFALGSSGRSFFVILLISIFAMLLVMRVRRLMTVAAVFAVLSLLTFAVGGVLLNKGGSLNRGLDENAASMYDSGIVYVLGSIPAMSNALSEETDTAMGANTLRLGFGVLQVAGFDVESAPLVPEFTEVPMLTNLYTVYYPYMHDFGLAGAVLLQLLFGAGHGFLYRKATVNRPKPFHVFLFAMTLMALTSQTGGDGYFTMMSTWIQYLFYGSLFLLIPWKHSTAAVRAVET